MSSEERKAFIERLKSRLDELDEKIDDFEKRSDEVSAKAREEYHQRVVELKKHRKDLANKYDEIRAGGEVQWNKLKREAEYTWDALQHSFNYFKSYFK
jgi:Skp family chaperone for outer membrane proteins